MSETLDAIFEVKRKIPDEPNFCFHATGRLECFWVDTGSSPRYRRCRICAPIPKGEQEGSQGTAESMEEIGEGAAEGAQKDESSH